MLIYFVYSPAPKQFEIIKCEEKKVNLPEIALDTVQHSEKGALLSTTVWSFCCMNAGFVQLLENP